MQNGEGGKIRVKKKKHFRKRKVKTKFDCQNTNNFITKQSDENKSVQDLIEQEIKKLEDKHKSEGSEDVLLLTQANTNLR